MSCWLSVSPFTPIASPATTVRTQSRSSSTDTTRGSSIASKEVVNAMKNTYHLQCFVCTACHQPIGTGSFHNEDGKIYCAKDWGALFQTKCYGCQFPIEPGDRWVEALSQNWHSECFNCSTCQINLEGQSFCAKNGKPYCKKHGAARRF